MSIFPLLMFEWKKLKYQSTFDPSLEKGTYITGRLLFQPVKERKKERKDK